MRAILFLMGLAAIGSMPLFVSGEESESQTSAKPAATCEACEPQGTQVAQASSQKEDEKKGAKPKPVTAVDQHCPIYELYPSDDDPNIWLVYCDGMTSQCDFDQPTTIWSAVNPNWPANCENDECVPATVKRNSRKFPGYWGPAWKKDTTAKYRFVSERVRKKHGKPRDPQAPLKKFAHVEINNGLKFFRVFEIAGRGGARTTYLGLELGGEDPDPMGSVPLTRATAVPGEDRVWIGTTTLNGTDYHILLLGHSE